MSYTPVQNCTCISCNMGTSGFLCLYKEWHHFPGHKLFVSLFSGIHHICIPAFPFDTPMQSGTYFHIPLCVGRSKGICTLENDATLYIDTTKPLMIVICLIFMPASGIHIREVPRAHVATIICNIDLDLFKVYY